MTLRIGIDGRPLERSLTGIGRYIYEICKELDNYLPKAHFFVYSQWPVTVLQISDRWTYRVDSAPFKKYMKSAVWLKLRAGRFCEQDRLDVYWAGATLLPRFRAPVRTVTTVYDLNHVMVPQSMPYPTLWAYRLFFRRDVLGADFVTTISKGTADRLYEHVGREADAVMTPAVSDSFRRPSPTALDSTLSSLQVRRPYLLALGTLEPRKNLDQLIHAFLSLKQEGKIPQHKLVLVGDRGWGDRKLNRLIQEASRRDVVPLGYVNDEHLPALYSGADLFLFPSLYEGFGMPILEARACGTAIVTTGIPELYEAGGDSAIYIEPTLEGIKEGILKALSVRKLNLTGESGWTWKDSARTLADMLAAHDGKLQL